TLGSAGIAAAGVEAASAGVPLPPSLAARHGNFNQTKDEGRNTQHALRKTQHGRDSSFVPSASSGQALRPSSTVGSVAVFDLVAQARSGSRPPVAERPALLQQLANLLAQPHASAVLLGEPGVGRRSLIQALAQ